MINVKAGNSQFLLMASQRQVTVGHKENRHVVEVEVMQQDERGKLQWAGKGVSLCHPTDKFDAKIGLKKAVQNYCDAYFLSKEQRKAFFKAIQNWA